MASQSRDSLLDRLSGIPSRAKNNLKAGFRVLDGISEDQLGKVLDQAQEAVSSRVTSRSEIQEIASSFNIPREDVSPLLSAATMTIVMLSQREETAEEFTQAAVEAGLLDESYGENTSRYVQMVLDRSSTIEKTLELSRITSRILPSILGTDIAVDARIDFEGKQAKLAAPVVLIHIDTDTDEDMWFQMSKVNLERMIEQLQETLFQVQVVESWLENSPLPKKDS